MFSKDYTKEFTVASAEINSIRLLSRMLEDERDAVKDRYWKQGFLGRFLVYLKDRIIHASTFAHEVAIMEFE